MSWKRRQPSEEPAEKLADYYRLKTEAVDDLVNASEENSPEVSAEELRKYTTRHRLRLADWVKAKTGVAPELEARGSAAIPAAHARAADVSAFAKVTVADAPKSWTQMVETDVITKEISTSYRYTYLVVNGLLHYDWPDLLK